MEEKIDLLLIEVKRMRKELKDVMELLELHRVEHGMGVQGGSASGSGQSPGGMMGGGQPNPMGGGQQQWGQGSPSPGQFPGGGGGGYQGGGQQTPGWGAPPGM